MIPGTWTRRDTLLVFAVALIGAAAYLGSVGHQFVYDDVMLFAQRPEFRSLADPWRVITTTWWNNALYRPFTQLSLAIDSELSGGLPRWFHIMNIALHGVASGLVFLLARRWLAAFGAAVAGFLFAVHPVHVEAVANIVGRAEIYATIFAVLAALLYAWDGDLAHGNNVSWRRWIASFGTLVVLLLGMASKESAFAIPGILLIVDWMDAKRQGVSLAERTKSHATLWFAAVALSVEWLIVRGIVVGSLAGDRPGPGLLGETLVGRILVMSPVVFHYIRLLVFPRHLSADYSPGYIEVDSSMTPLTAAGLLVTAGLVMLAVLIRNRTPLVTFALMWIGGSLLVVSNLIVPTGVILAERSMYLPSVGAVLIFGWLGVEVHKRRPRLTTAVASVIVVLGLARTVTRVPIWKNADTFFPRLVQDAPGSFRSLWVAGMLHYNLGDKPRGEQLVREALRVYPLYPNTWHDYGALLEELGRWDEAGVAFANAYRIDTTRTYDAASAVSNFARAGDLDTARVLVRRIRDTDPHDPNVQAALGDLALAEGRPLEAMTWLRQVAWQMPRMRDIHLRVAEAAARAGYCPQVRESMPRITETSQNESRVQALRALIVQAGCEPPEAQ